MRRARHRGRRTRPGTVTLIMSAIAPATSTPVGPPPTIDEVQRAAVDQRRVAIDLLEQARGSASAAAWRCPASTAGTSSRRRRGCWKKFGCEPAASTSASAVHALAVARRHGLASPCSTAGISASFTSTLSLSGKHPAQRVRDVARRQLRGCHLIEQRLELVVVVAVDQRDRDAIVVGQFAARSPVRQSRRRRSPHDADHLASAHHATARRGGRGRSGAQALEQVVADPQRVRHRGQRRVDRADAREEAGVDDVQVVELVRLAVGVERRAARIAAEPDGARLVGTAGDRDLVLEVGVVGSRCPWCMPRSLSISLSSWNRRSFGSSLLARVADLDVALPRQRDPVLGQRQVLGREPEVDCVLCDVAQRPLRGEPASRPASRRGTSPPGTCRPSGCFPAGTRSRPFPR